MSTKIAARPSRKRPLTPLARLEHAFESGAVVAALESFGISHQLIAAATGATDRSVRNWKKTSAIAAKYEEPLRDLKEIVVILSETLTPRGVGQWLRARDRLLGGRRPTEALAAGNVKAVRQAAYSFLDGSYV